MITIRRSARLLLVVICVFAIGCGAVKDLNKTLGELTEVRNEIIKKFGDENVDVRANTFQNRTNISVTFVNSPLNEKNAEERWQRAQQTAEIVKQHYKQIKAVSQIWVGFMRVKTRFLIFHWSEAFDIRGFDNEARALREFVDESGPSPSDPSQPVISYSAKQNRTDISTTGIQLEGTPENGVTLVPHFSLVGNVNRVTPQPPNEVSLDFAAYSDKPRFPDVTRIVFITDNKISYQTEGQFSTSKLTDGVFSEFLYLKVPASAFLEITSGKTVRIKLEKREYLLTEVQVLLMQRMSDYLKT